MTSTVKASTAGHCPRDHVALNVRSLMATGDDTQVSQTAAVKCEKKKIISSAMNKGNFK